MFLLPAWLGLSDDDLFQTALVFKQLVTIRRPNISPPKVRSLFWYKKTVFVHNSGPLRARDLGTHIWTFWDVRNSILRSRTLKNLKLSNFKIFNFTSFYYSETFFCYLLTKLKVSRPFQLALGPVFHVESVFEVENPLKPQERSKN